MQTRPLAAAAMLTGGILANSTASAQALDVPIACTERSTIVERLEQGFGEVQKGAGLVSAAQLLEVWGSDETGTWTVLITGADGRSCMIAAGEAWRDSGPDLVIKGDPA